MAVSATFAGGENGNGRCSEICRAREYVRIGVASVRWSGRRPKHEQIAAELRAAIVAGRFGPRRRLPSQRRLADEFAVSRATIVSAFDILRAQGLIETRRGAGSWVRRRT